ncbi:MAG: polysaccharide deacetylase family protein [Coriobacteriia bacterium]|nr:polysaccharide deacetylase family protein [Coriobacteriia bacterium]
MGAFCKRMFEDWRGSLSFVLTIMVLSLLLCCTRTAFASDWSDTLYASVYSTSDKSITLKWSNLTGKTVDKYVVYKAKGDKKGKKLKTLSATATKYKVAKLKKNKKYSFVVVAKLAGGKSVRSLVVNAKAQGRSKSRNVKKVTPKCSALVLKELGSKQLTAKVATYSGKKAFDKKIRFVSSNSKIAKVSSDGHVSAIAPGTCYVYSVAHTGEIGKTKVVVNQGLLVLGYHGVATDWEKQNLYPNDKFTITLGTFEKQLKRLHDKGYKTISCEEYYQWMKGKISLPKRTVLITFDDARYCAVKNAPAVLKKYGMKSTWFVIGKRTATSDGTDAHRYTATVDDLTQMIDEYSGVELQGHSYGLHDTDSVGKALIYSKSYEDVLDDFSQLNSFASKSGLGNFKYFAYPYGSDPEWYRKGVKDSGVKAAFGFGDDALAAKTDNIYAISRVGVRTTTTDSVFNKWVR